MNIDQPLKPLGTVAIAPLLNAVNQLPADVWKTNNYRQKAYDVHVYTESLVLLFTTGAGWPSIEVKKESAWELLAEEVMPIVNQILEAHYPVGGQLIRIMAAKLPPGGVIKTHTDKHPSFSGSHRIHVPLTTNNFVRFMIDGRPYQFEVGQAYEINNQLNHSVLNRGKTDRITLIFDYLPPTPGIHVDSDLQLLSEAVEPTV